MLIESVLGIINKVIPDRDKQDEIKKLLIEAELKQNEFDLETLKTKKSILEKIIPMTFPALAYILCGCYIIDICFQVYSGITNTQVIPLSIPKGLEDIVDTYLMFFFGSKTVKTFSKK